MIAIDPLEALELPVDELALLVLADMIRAKTWSAYNYTLSYTSDATYRICPGAPEAIAEAVEWLRANGMIAAKPGDGASQAIFITRRGIEASKQDVRAARSISRLQGNLHPLIERKARRQFLLGEYENAIFVSMKAIEVRVRELGGYGHDVVGVDLMTRAFKPGGPLADSAAPGGEVEGTMALFRGAYAVLRNPSGHREVSFEDVTEASEAVMTASLLMRMLDKISERLA
ncbi:hypothetical protein GCM10018781_38800 [Kitasatospora indigofera]|uniref:Conserved hypothetical protein CHP02391 domain-containing protein n=1 Tax=Kitasatospora indigofera TaxID=67307 RepID=A0A919FWN4_9ACTN|nr:TIGR02391 family protein [Kitasatospora indigofera]GHH73760.1 hypothetical protein GCM10018781_38800 [Kitasatospora indigofera]